MTTCARRYATNKFELHSLAFAVSFENRNHSLNILDLVIKDATVYEVCMAVL
jgi:hypothetical protein